MSNESVLPDSRLKSRKNTVMALWKIDSTKSIRLELEPIYCLNCGKMSGYVPCEVMTFVSWLCDPCSEKWGQSASMHKAPDSEFWDKVSGVMLERYGRALTQQELYVMAETGKLSRDLQLLARESPIKTV